MMDDAATIQPFGFDRVFFHSAEPLSGPEEELIAADAGELVREPGVDDLRETIARLEAKLARIEDAQQGELARARSDGFEAGLVQARTEREEAQLAATDALHAGLEAIEAQLTGIEQQMSGEVARIAFGAAEMLAGHAIDSAPSRAIDEALGRAIEQVARGTALVLRVNPVLAAAMAELVAAREGAAGRALAVTIIEDPTLPENDGRIEWNCGGLEVDAAARRAAVMAELEGLLA